MNKFCVNCLYFRWQKNPSGRGDVGACTNYEAAATIDVVSGARFPADPTDLYILRGVDGACGYDSKLFKEKA